MVMVLSITTEKGVRVTDRLPKMFLNKVQINEGGENENIVIVTH